MSTFLDQARARADNHRAIREMCALAGQPNRAQAFIAAGADRQTVLTDLRATQGTAVAGPGGGAARAQSSMRRELARAGLRKPEPHDDSRTGRAETIGEASMRRELAQAQQGEAASRGGTDSGGAAAKGRASMERELKRAGLSGH